MTYQVRVHHAPLGISADEVSNALKTFPKVLLTVQPYMNKAATLAPRVVPILKQLMPLLALGPTLAPLAAVISKDVATVLKNAPSYTGTLTEVMDQLAKAPELAAQVAAVTGKMATLSQKIGEDPALGLFIDRMTTIIDLYEARKAASGSSASASTSSSSTPGIGLKWMIPWMDRGIYALKHPYLALSVPALTVVAIGLLGFSLGRMTKS